jgi:hypothetical protein
MGKKMAEGGVVKRDLVDGMDEDGVGEGMGIFLIASYVDVQRLVSQGKLRRIPYYGCGWPSWCNTTHDQWNCHCNIEAGLRVQR